MTSLIRELRELKAKATAGVWVHRDNDQDRVDDIDGYAIATAAYSPKPDGRKAANIAYIVALANSAAALLDAAEENVRLRKALEWYATTNAPEVARTALKGTP